MAIVRAHYFKSQRLWFDTAYETLTIERVDDQGDVHVIVERYPSQEIYQLNRPPYEIEKFVFPCDGQQPTTECAYQWYKDWNLRGKVYTEV